jgi:hypothetical protein
MAPFLSLHDPIAKAFAPENSVIKMPAETQAGVPLKRQSHFARLLS